MKRWRAGYAFAAALIVAGCGKTPRSINATPAPELKNGHPVVHIPPVETRPFEDGYNAGFAYGKKLAAPGAAVPGDEESRRIAHEQAGGLAERTERWERGFAEGYADGVRNVVTGQK